MEITEKSQFSKVEEYGTDYEDYDDLPDIESSKYLESLDIKLPYSMEQTVDDIDLKYLPSTSKIPMLSDNQTTENFIKEFESFYSDMMGKVQGLKNVPALQKPNYKEIDNIDDENLFSNIKCTPEIQDQLDCIKKLDDEIKSVISDYHSEKAERLETQLEMCNEIAKSNSVHERDTELFLSLCDFEFSAARTEEKEKKRELIGDTRKQKTTSKTPNDFIMRNIYLAKEGVFANSSLTDEEKVKLEDILLYDDDEPQQRSPFTLPSVDCVRPKMFSNAYSFTADDEKKIEEIDSELEKFKLDERKSEKDLANKEELDQSAEIKVMNELKQLNQVLLENKLKKLEERLKEIQDAEKKDIEKLQIIKDKTAKNKDNEDLNQNEDFGLGDLLKNYEFDDNDEIDLLEEIKEDENLKLGEDKEEKDNITDLSYVNE